MSAILSGEDEDFEIIVAVPEEVEEIELPREKLKALIELLDTLNWDKRKLKRYVNAALRLRRLERERGKSYLSLFREYEKLSKEEVKLQYSISQLREKREKIEEDLRLYMEQHKLTLELVGRVAALISALEERGLGLEDLERGLNILENLKASGYDVDKLLEELSRHRRLSEEIGELEGRVETLRAKAERLEKERQALEEELREAYGILDGLRGLREEVKRLRDERARVYEELESLRRDAEEIRGEVERLTGVKDSVEEAERVAEEKREEIERLRKEEADLRREIGELLGVKGEVGEIREKVRDAEKEIERLEKSFKEGKLHPKKAKKMLAFELVRFYYSEEEAKYQDERFERVFSKKEVPPELVSYPVNTDKIWVVELLRLTGLARSGSEARRLIQQGGVKWDGERIREIDRIIFLRGEHILQVGKKKFLKVVKR